MSVVDISIGCHTHLNCIQNSGTVWVSFVSFFGGIEINIYSFQNACG